MLIIEQILLMPPQGYSMERLVGKGHDEAAQIKTADPSMTLFCFETVLERNEV